MPNLVRLACPCCDENLAEDTLHSNILLCPKCGNYTYYDAGMYNENVFFGLLKSRSYTIEGLRRSLIERFVKKESLRGIRNIKHLYAERLLVPVREIDDQGKMVLLMKQTYETKNVNADIRELISNIGENVYNMFSVQYLQPVRLNVVQDGTKVLPIERSKQSVDAAYGLEYNSLLRILYIPVFRIWFNDEQSRPLLCFANETLTGLPISIKEIKNVVQAKVRSSVKSFLIKAAKISFFVAVFFVIILFLFGNNSIVTALDGKDTSYAVILIAIFIILAFLFSLVSLTPVLTIVLYIYSRFKISLNVIPMIKRWAIRRALVNVFDDCKLNGEKI